MRGPGTTYNYLRKHTLAAAIGALLIAAGVLLSGTLSSNAAGETLGVDAIPDGSNTASGLGEIQGCREVQVSDTFDVDIFIANVSSLQAWELRLAYNPSQLTVTSTNLGFMIGGFPLAVDEGAGSYFFGALATTSVSGSGVLVRVTLQANAPGLSPLSIRNSWPYGPILSDQGGHPGDTNGDNFFDGPIANAQIAIGQSCSGVTPPPTQTQPVTPTPSSTPVPTPTLTLPPTPVPTPTGTVGGTTPTPSPTFIPVPGSIPWGDINCANSVTIDDAVYIAMLKTGAAVSPTGSPCPDIGDQVFGAPIAVKWGDFDCSQQFDLGDVIAIMRYLIGLTGGIGGCPLIATNYVSFP